jgi:hypothetical protein
MIKEGGDFIQSLLDSLDEAEHKLEQAYHSGDALHFNQAKRLMLQVQTKISEVVK